MIVLINFRFNLTSLSVLIHHAIFLIEQPRHVSMSMPSGYLVVLLFSLLVVPLYFFLKLVELIVCRVDVHIDVLHKGSNLFTEGLSNSDLRVILGISLASPKTSQQISDSALLLNLIQFLHLLLDLPHVLNIFLLGALDLGLEVKELLLGVVHVLAVVLEVV